MTIEEPGKIDIIAETPNGGLDMIAVDPGLITNPNKRFQAILQKLSNYLAYVVSDQFAQDYPKVKRSQVAFRVTCAKPPTAKMQEIGVMKHRDFPELAIDVEYEVIASRF